MVYPYGSGGYRCLGGAVHVPHLGFRKALKQTSRSLRGECFAAKKKTPNPWQHSFCKFLLDQTHLCKRWGGDPGAGARICERVIKHFGIGDQIAADTEKSASCR